jgi:hypothetical protein
VDQALSEHLTVADLELAVSSLGHIHLKSFSKNKKKVSENLDSDSNGPLSNIFKFDGKYLKIKKISLNIETLDLAQKKSLAGLLESLAYEIKKDPSVVTVSSVEPILESLISGQKPSIEI